MDGIGSFSTTMTAPAVDAGMVLSFLTVLLTFFTVVLMGCTVLLTGVYVLLNKGLLDEARRQRSPLMSLHIAPTPEHLGLLYLTIENVGRSAAYEVQIAVEAERASAVSERVKAFGSVANGIRYMAPGQTLSTYIANTLEAGTEHTLTSSFQLRSTYKDSDGKRHESVCPVDLRMYDRLESMQPMDQVKRIADAVERISRSPAISRS